MLHDDRRARRPLGRRDDGGLCPRAGSTRVHRPATYWAPARRRLVAPARRAPAPGFAVTLDRDFDLTTAACARPAPGRRPNTPLAPALIEAFARLHDEGVAPAFEVRARERLVAGGFGVALGGVFVLEATFAYAPDALDAGVCALEDALAAFGFSAIDVTAVDFAWPSATLVERDAYTRLLVDNCAGLRPGR